MPNKFLFRLFEDKIGNDIRSQTKVYKRWIKKDKVVYSVEKEIDVKTLQIKYKRPITFRETQFSRFIIVYDKQLGSIPFEAVEGNKIVFGVGLEGLVTIPLNTEINSLLIAGCSGSGKSSMTKSIITNLILNNIPTWVMDNKKSHDYNVFENHLPLYKGIDQFSEFLNKVSNELDSRLLKKHNKPLVIVIDEVFSIKLLKNGKILLDKLAVLLSTCRGGYLEKQSGRKFGSETIVYAVKPSKQIRHQLTISRFIYMLMTNGFQVTYVDVEHTFNDYGIRCDALIEISYNKQNYTIITEVNLNTEFNPKYDILTKDMIEGKMKIKNRVLFVNISDRKFNHEAFLYCKPVCLYTDMRNFSKFQYLFIK